MGPHTALLQQLQAELEEASKSLAFWKIQPSALATGATKSTLQLRGKRIRELEGAVVAIKQGLAVLSADDVKGS